MPHFIKHFAILLAPTLGLTPVIAGNYYEADGIVSVEAEDYAAQALSSTRAWYRITKRDVGLNIMDRDRNHAATASGESYIEVLPDTRATHADKLIKGINFMNEPGKMAVLSYNIHFQTAGDYLVWVRAFSTGAEDNGLHVGINGTWPESGQRIQLCQGKHRWTWSSAQRVPENHCGYPKTIRIRVPNPGLHTITFSMREDGFEFDKFLMTRDESYEPEGLDLPATFRKSESYAELSQRSAGSFEPTRLLATADFNATEVDGYIPYYVDKARDALAINAGNESFRNRPAAARHRFTGEAGSYALTLYTMKETDGESEYTVSINGVEVLRTTNAPTSIDYSLHESHAKENVQLKQGDAIQVTSNAVTNGLIPEGDITAFSRGRWTELMLIPE